MTAITPQTEIRLVKCPLELTDLNQLTFATKTAQYNYFNGLTHVTADNATYVRKDGYIRYPAEYDEIIQYNYVMYQNEAYSNKWFYAYIDKMEYLSNGTTAVYISTDCFQTWQFDLTYKKTFVEREHTNDDTIGANTLPESLDIGEPQIVELRNIPMYESLTPSTDWLVCFSVTKLPGGIDSFTDERETIGSVFTTLHTFACATTVAARNILKIYESDDNLSTAINNIYMVPRSCVSYNPANAQTEEGHTPTSVSGGGVTAFIYPVKDSAVEGPYYLQESDKLAGNYTPVNNKLFCYPFSYFYLTNKAGTDVLYKWEDFPTQKIGDYTRKTFGYRKAYVPTASISAKLYPINYKGKAEGESYGERLFNYGINYAKVPVCAWTTDVYTNWLTQNGVNMVTSGLNSVAGMVGSTITGGMAGGGLGMAIGFIGGMFSTATNITKSVAEVESMSKTPPQANGDANSSDVMFAYNRNSITFYAMSVRPEVAAIVDSYFSMYGYKTNKVKVPNITGRVNWNFVKTIGCYIAGDIPQEDMTKIKEMFDAGITLWHNPTTFMDYSQSNSIVV